MIICDATFIMKKISVLYELFYNFLIYKRKLLERKVILFYNGYTVYMDFYIIVYTETRK